MPTLLKPSFQRKVAVAATPGGAVAQWLHQLGSSAPQLLRSGQRRYFGSAYRRPLRVEK